MLVIMGTAAKVTQVLAGHAGAFPDKAMTISGFVDSATAFLDTAVAVLKYELDGLGDTEEAERVAHLKVAIATLGYSSSVFVFGAKK